MHRLTSSFLFFALACAAIVATPARAVTPVVWTLTVPTPATANVSSSTLSSITSDALGDAFVVISLTTSTNLGGIPMTFPAGSQLFLLNAKGKVVSKAEVADVEITPIYISAKRVIAVESNTIVQFAANAQGVLVRTVLNTQTQGEGLLPSDPQNENFKYLHSAVTANGLVTEVKRYQVTKLAP